MKQGDTSLSIGRRGTISDGAPAISHGDPHRRDVLGLVKFYKSRK